MQLRFHWSMSSAGEKWRGAQARCEQSGLPNLEACADFCRHAEECGMDSVLTAIGFHRPDPIVLAAALGMLTDRIKFMVAVRSGLMSPTSFVQQVNTLSALTNGRVCLNVVAGHTPAEQRSYGDFLSHDERYDRTDEYLTICRALWESEAPVTFEGKYYRIENAKLNTPFVSDDRRSPEIFVGGNSSLAEGLAVRHADCLWRLPDAPTKLKQNTMAVVEQGTEVGLLMSILARPTRDEAVADAYRMIEALGSGSQQSHRNFARRSDSVAFTSTFRLAEETNSDWVTPCLWTGAVPYLGAPSIALVGSAQEVAGAILDYKQIGISQFLFMGWPDVEEMAFFSREVLPLVRQMEGDSDDAAGIRPLNLKERTALSPVA